jgi:hypothetical protein
MADVPLPSASPWNRRQLTIPPDSALAWIRLAVWEFWMGVVVCAAIGVGVHQIVTAPDRVVTLRDLSGCYAPAHIDPCERITRTGAMNVVFAALLGATLVLVAGWLLWELWNAVEPKPITDDFLKLLDDSFGRSWRNPLTWPWARISYAYGFTVVGVASTVCVGVVIWTLVSSPEPVRKPSVETSESFRLKR